MRALVSVVLGWLLTGCGGSVDSNHPNDASVDATDRGWGAPNDASAEDADGCEVVVPTDYDQSCTADTDCVLVGSVPSCPANSCDFCLDNAVNTDAAPSYQAALVRVQAALVASTTGLVIPCSCLCEGIAVCRGGHCQAGGCGPPPIDTLAACRDAGGMCVYKATLASCALRQTDGCAYDDETCCVP
jgi:hypothetical protein